MSGPGPGIIDNAMDLAIKQTTAYRNLSEKIIDHKGKCELASTCLKVAIVAFALLGIAITACCGAAGLVPLLITLPLGFAAYNLDKFTSNIDQILQYPSRCMTLNIKNKDLITVNSEALKSKLKEKTVFCSWIIDKAADSILEKAGFASENN